MKAIAKIEKTAVIGAGSWGTALAKLLGDKGESLYLWGHDKAHIAEMAQSRINVKYLDGNRLAENITLTSSLEVVKECQCVVMVIPSHGYREVFRQLVPLLREDCFVVSAVKGIENNSLQTMTQIMADEITTRPDRGKNISLGVLSGPSFAEEVATAQPTAVTVAFSDNGAACAVQELFSTQFFRTYTSEDVLGLEISAAMKNVIAIAAGISDGLQYGLNTRAALITRGLAEITRFGVILGANPLTFSGLGGLGDLVLTCTGNLSRNRTVGLKLGQGKSLPQALSEMTNVAEGVKTTRSCHNLARKHNVDMPILDQVYNILYKDKDPRQAVSDLFQRSLKDELCPVVDSKNHGEPSAQ